MEDYSGKKEKFHLIKPHFFQPLLSDFVSNFTIPKSFLKHLGENVQATDEKIALLRNKRVDIFWGVTLMMSFDDDKLHFKDGWKKFCEDNGLHVGDFLVFMYHHNFVFDVFIFDNSFCERPFPSSVHPTDTPLIKVKSSRLTYNSPKEAEVNFKPRGYPFCQALVKSYCLTWGGMVLPYKFARENGLTKKCSELTLKDQTGRIWKLSLRPYRKSVYIANSWRKFHRTNRLKVGDSVIFELIASGGTTSMNFYRLQRKKDFNNDVSSPSPVPNVSIKTRGHPCCYVTVKPYHLRWGRMILPIKFVRENDLIKKWRSKTHVTLIDKKGKAWKLPYKYRKHINVFEILGMRNFHLETGVKVHDSVVFEVIALKGRPAMKFYKLYS